MLLSLPAFQGMSAVVLCADAVWGKDLHPASPAAVCCQWEDDVNSQASIRCHCFNLGGFGVKNSGPVEISGVVDFQVVKILLFCSLTHMVLLSLKNRASFLETVIHVIAYH